MKLNDIYNIDCMDGMKQLDDNSIDLIVTSPPYNKVGFNSQTSNGGMWNKGRIEYDTYGDSMDEITYYKWQIEFLKECYRVIKPSGSIFYNHKVRRKNSLAYYPTWVLNADIPIKQFIIWDRCVCHEVKNMHLYPTTELIFWMTKETPKFYRDRGIFKSEVWKFPPDMNNSHPAPFPYKLVENCILLTTDENDVVLDPFMGSGTTGVVCKDYHRHYIGFDISDKYISLAKNRINNHIKGVPDNIGYNNENDGTNKVELF